MEAGRVAITLGRVCTTDMRARRASSTNTSSLLKNFKARHATGNLFESSSLRTPRNLSVKVRKQRIALYLTIIKNELAYKVVDPQDATRIPPTEEASSVPSSARSRRER